MLVNGIDITTWYQWMGAAIKEIRSRKLKPTSKRILNIIQENYGFSKKVIKEALDACINAGYLLKGDYNGQCTTCQKQHKRSWHHSGDIRKEVVRTCKELGERGGSSLKAIERHIMSTYDVELAEGVDFKHVLKVSIRGAIEDGLLIKHSNKYEAVDPHRVIF